MAFSSSNLITASFPSDLVHLNWDFQLFFFCIFLGGIFLHFIFCTDHSWSPIVPARNKVCWLNVHSDREKIAEFLENLPSFSQNLHEPQNCVGSALAAAFLVLVCCNWFSNQFGSCFFLAVNDTVCRFFFHHAGNVCDQCFDDMFNYQYFAFCNKSGSITLPLIALWGGHLE